MLGFLDFIITSDPNNADLLWITTDKAVSLRSELRPLAIDDQKLKMSKANATSKEQACPNSFLTNYLILDAPILNEIVRDFVGAAI